MKFDNEIEVFINDFVKDLNEGTASVFAGAGLSIPTGYVNWSELMTEIAQDLGLDINIEKDLISIAQFHVNENRTRSNVITSYSIHYTKLYEIKQWFEQQSKAISYYHRHYIVDNEYIPFDLV